jgi:hypothetical protein
MFSFFKHVESLVAVEEKAVSTAALNDPLNGGEEKPARCQSKHPKVTPIIIPDAARQMVSPGDG